MAGATQGQVVSGQLLRSGLKQVERLAESDHGVADPADEEPDGNQVLRIDDRRSGAAGMASGATGHFRLL
jgi:hypothetical protein